ncbi:probable G-protein coupled receptor Mth-like 11 isoform X1 [Ostrinia furnacalis]|uniref:probable G-protein coupled receptor Mth-like 11 isoform X1 n=1 Tax=Ostrinia furnacalis TaxID=93504 RepID=UPI00103BD218|nr:probable G-protein coupled receptor Mth-like 11 isoform X1 [Ostrinia furnacalis]
MWKIIVSLSLCICVKISCAKLKCDVKEIIDIQTKKILPDKDDFCKDKICVFRLCVKSNSMLVNAVCTTYDDVSKKLNMTVNPFPWNKIHDLTKTPSNEIKSNISYIRIKNFNKLIKDKCVTDFFVDPAHLLEDGSVLIGDDRIEPGNFIVEYKTSQRKDGTWTEPMLKVRKLTGEEEDEDFTSKLCKAIVIIISCFFMALVIVIYSMFKKLRSSQYGKILLAYVACLTATFSLKAVQILMLKTFTSTACKIFSEGLLYAFLACFFWSNVMSYKVWRAVRSNYQQVTTQPHKFLQACLYGFGMPLLMLVGAVLIEELNPKFIKIKPKFYDCMLSENATLYYLYVPITIMSCINVIFYLMTLYSLYMKKKDSNNTFSGPESKNTKQNKNMYIIYAKLSLLTGLNWIVDVIGAYVDFSRTMDLILDFSNIILGIILFITCVCQKSVLRLLCKRFNISIRCLKSQAQESSMDSTNIRKSSSQRNRQA